MTNSPPSDGRSFHCLQATSQALQPMHVVVSVKKPIRWAPGRWIAVSVIARVAAPRDGRGRARRPARVSCLWARRWVPVDTRPARTLQTNALDSWIDVFGSPESVTRSFAASPGEGPPNPQCQGRPTWWMVRPSIFSGRIRSVTFARASMSARGEEIVIQPPSSIPCSAASTGSISANISGCSSLSHGSQRDMPPAVWCSVSRKVVATCGHSDVGSSAVGLSGRSQRSAAGFAWREG